MLQKISISIFITLARFVLKKYKPKVIVVAGSVGKTSTKDAVYAVLSKYFFIRKSLKGISSTTELPMTVLGCDENNESFWETIKNIWYGVELILFKEEYPKYLILETAVRKPRDMQKMITWLKADYVVFGRFGNVPTHIEFFNKSRDLIEENSKLIKIILSSGVLFLNNDDTNTMSLKEKTKNKVVTFGFNESASFRASNLEIAYRHADIDMPLGIVFRFDHSSSSFPVRIEGALGSGHVYGALVALAIANEIGLNLINSAQTLQNYVLPAGRMRLLDGIKESTIIDDSYNSSPMACETALKTLEDIKTIGQGDIKRRKIVVLGDMLELGNHTDEEHKNIGKIASKIADILICVGLRARGFVDGALIGGMSEKNIYHFENSTSAGVFLKNIIAQGDIILVKGSQIIRMENTVVEIMAHPEDASELLVRQ